jgi:hypothetical protein
VVRLFDEKGFLSPWFTRSFQTNFKFAVIVNYAVLSSNFNLCAVPVVTLCAFPIFSFHVRLVAKEVYFGVKLINLLSWCRAGLAQTVPGFGKSYVR